MLSSCQLLINSPILTIADGFFYAPCQAHLLCVFLRRGVGMFGKEVGWEVREEVRVGLNEELVGNTEAA